MAKQLLLTNYTIPVNSPINTVIGTITNKITSSTLSLVDDAFGKFKLVGLTIQTNSIITVPGIYLINIKETNSLGLEITQVGIVVA